MQEWMVLEWAWSCTIKLLGSTLCYLRLISYTTFLICTNTLNRIIGLHPFSLCGKEMCLLIAYSHVRVPSKQFKWLVLMDSSFLQCRAFEVRCLHIPTHDRTSFEGVRVFLLLIFLKVIDLSALCYMAVVMVICALKL